MRCGCPECGTYMVQSEGIELGCVCPACGCRCKGCLGTNTVLSRETLKELKEHPERMENAFRGFVTEGRAETDEPSAPDVD